MVIIVIMVIMVIRCQLRRTSQPANEAADSKTFVTAPEGLQDSALGPPVCSLFSDNLYVTTKLRYYLTLADGTDVYSRNASN